MVAMKEQELSAILVAAVIDGILKSPELTKIIATKISVEPELRAAIVEKLDAEILGKHIAWQIMSKANSNTYGYSHVSEYYKKVMRQAEAFAAKELAKKMMEETRTI